MADDEENIEEIIERYEKQFLNNESADIVVRANSLMVNKLHALTNELLTLALHAEKEETRLKAILAVQARILGPITADTTSESEADKMFKMLEAKSKKRAAKHNQSSPDSPES